MPTLNWIGKDKIVNHHRDVPFHLLQHEYNFNSDSVSENKIIQGDNLLALKSLLPEYEGRVKCIYIDPPYNTGNEGWVYNDNVSDPRLKRWLDKVVGKEGEDLSRHDKWLCMMYPRLQLLRRLLADDGAIFISIDDNEQANLKLMCDEIFGAGNFVASNVWQKRYSRENRGIIGDAHEYILVYTKVFEKFKNIRNKLPLGEKQLSVYKNPNKDPQGLWRSVSFSAQGFRPNQMYEIVSPKTGKKFLPPEGSCWKVIESQYFKLLEDNRMYFGKDGNAIPQRIQYLKDIDGIVPWTWWNHEDVGHTDEARKEIQKIFGSQTAFETPKPTRLLERILQIATNPNDLILDSFAGSGTTAHAVLNLNAKDGGNRKFILIQCDEMDKQGNVINICEDITAERVRRVIQNAENTVRVQNADSVTPAQLDAFSENVADVKTEEIVETTDKKLASFSYYRLGEKLFDPEFGDLNEAAPLAALHAYIWYSETLLPYTATPSGYYLGEHFGTGYVFAYEKEMTTVLDESLLEMLRQVTDTLEVTSNVGKYVIYADICLLPDEFMRKQSIVFKKIPRQIIRI